MPALSITDPGWDIDDLGSIGHGVYQFQAAFIELQRNVFLSRIPRIDAEDDSLWKRDQRLERNTPKGCWG